MIEIDLARSHAGACREMAAPLHAQLSNGYTHRVSTMPLSGEFDDYLAEHRTARKRAARAHRLGYETRVIDRRDYENDIFSVNVSAPERQGRPMTEAYRERPHFGPNPVSCAEHHVYAFGLLDERSRLWAYLWLYRCGDLALISSILGHADRLRDDVMYALVLDAIEAQIGLGGTLVYNLHASGTDGLRYFKERLGLSPTEVSWKL